MMLSLIGTLGSSLISGVTGYFATKQEIKRVQVEADKKLIAAKAEAKIKKLERESEQDYNLDKIATENMNNSWKDEVILIIFLIPLVMSFIPEYQIYVNKGFEALNKVPDWYMGLLVGMIVVIYGMRGLLKAFMQIIANKFTK